MTVLNQKPLLPHFLLLHLLACLTVSLRATSVAWVARLRLVRPLY
jgi:hypothetical protein